MTCNSLAPSNSNKICVSLDATQALQYIKNTDNNYLLEFRIDALALNMSALKHLISLHPNCIITCRNSHISTKQKYKILKYAIINGAKYIDCDINQDVNIIAKLKNACTKYNCILIASYHNYKNTPNIDILNKILKRCINTGGNISKIVCTAQNDTDSNTILELYKKTTTPLIAFCMGEIGKQSRINAYKLGSPINYCSINSNTQTAPGQWSIEEFLFQLSKTVKAR